MEEYIGKICPFCRAEIREGEPVKVCPSCGIPHHMACWIENKGCTTFGCMEKYYGAPSASAPAPQIQQPAPQVQQAAQGVFCINCGAPMGENEAFCVKCGTPRTAEKKKICSKCGTELQEGQAFCPRCGQKADLQVNSSVNAAILQYNTGVVKEKKKGKKAPLIIGLIAALVIGLGVGAFFVITNLNAAKAAEAAKNEYLKDAEEFLSLSYKAAANLEDIADTIQEYWHENIWENKHGKDIETAILYAMIDKSSEITLAETYNTRLETLYNKVKKLPSEIADKDKEELKEICSAIKDLYSVYCTFYDLATDPSGSYNSFSDKNNSTTDSFIEKHNTLKRLLD